MSTVEVKCFDLGDATVSNPKIFVSALRTPAEYYDDELAFRDVHVRQQTESIFETLGKAIREEANLVLLPEMSIPDQARLYLRTWCVQAHSYVIGGLEIGPKRRNLACVCTPYGTIYEVPKVSPSPKSLEAKLWRRQDDSVYVFTKTGIGTFAVLTCYDVTNSALTSPLRGIIESLFVPAHDRGPETLIAARSLAYQNYCWSVYCNNGVHASYELTPAAVFAPVRSYEGKPVVDDTVKIATAKNLEISTRIDLTSLRSAKTGGGYEFGGTHIAVPPSGFAMGSNLQSTEPPPAAAIPNAQDTGVWSSLLTFAVQRLAFGVQWKSEYAKLTLLSALNSRSLGFSDLGRLSPLSSRQSYSASLADLVSLDLVARRGRTYEITEEGRLFLQETKAQHERIRTATLAKVAGNLRETLATRLSGAGVEYSRACYLEGWRFLESLAESEQMPGSRRDTDLQEMAYSLWKTLASISGRLQLIAT